MTDMRKYIDYCSVYLMTLLNLLNIKWSADSVRGSSVFAGKELFE